METKKMTAEDIKKMTERMKNSKNPIIRRILAMVEKKMEENAKSKEE
jgi:hypothetical protein